MASNPTLLFVKAKAVENLLAKVVPQDCPSIREASIQIAKLLRMLGRFLKKYEHNLGSLKKRKKNKAARRDYGEDVQRLYEQEKAMQKQLNKSLEEWWVRADPTKTKKSFRKEMQKINVFFDKQVYTLMTEYRRELVQLMGKSTKKALEGVSISKPVKLAP